MNFTNFVSTIAVIFAVGCSSSSDVSTQEQGTSTEVVVEPIAVETTHAVNEAVVGPESTSQSTEPVVCPEGVAVVDGVCQTAQTTTTVTTEATSTVSH
jgi:hypothetical protein